MKHRSMYWKGLLACAALIVTVTSAFAVTEADVIRLKNKVVNGEQLTSQEKQLALEARRELGSRILDQGRVDSDRVPRHTLDEYSFETVAYEWIDISEVGTSAGITSDDENVGPFDLGFSFPYYEQSYTSIRMCSNGWASFTATSAEYFNSGIPDATATPNNALYVFWDDMLPPSGGTFLYYSDVANDRFIMSWINVPHIGTTDELYTYQIVLYENGTIQYNYQLVSTGATYNNSTCTVGIENLAGTEALQICFDGSGTLPVSETSFRISQPEGAPVAPSNIAGDVSNGVITITWTDPTVDTDGNPVVLDHMEVYRNGTLQTSVAPGVQTYTDNTPPIGNISYAVRGCVTAGCGGSATVTLFNGPFEVIDYDWVDISQTGTSAGITGDDQNVGPFDLGFEITYFGQTYNQVYMCGNGWASFTSTSAIYFNTEIPDAPEPNTAMYVFWDDMYPPSGGQFMYQAEPGRFILSWIDVPHINSDEARYSYQIVIYDYGQIDYNYQAVSTNDPSNTSCTVGIENAGGTEALQICYNGVGAFIPESETSISFFNVPPNWGPLSGTLTLDGGAGDITQALIRANGPGQRTRHPDVNGAFAFDSVAVGDRVISASLAGYVTNSVAVPNHTEGGTTGVNLTIMRVDPPVPTNLTGSVDNATGVVTLNWDDSADPLVDVYPVYRRLQGEETWVLQGSPTVSSFTQNLTDDGIYEYAVAARDNDVSTPVESELTEPLTVLYGALPPVGLSANGNYDDRIVLNWFSPGTSPLFELYYDSVDVDPTCVEDGLGFTAQFPFAWFVAHYEANGPATITRVKTFHWANSAPGCQVQMGVFEDDGNGFPTFTPLGATDWTIADPLAWQDVALNTPVTVEGSFFVGIRQMTAQRVDIGMDFCAESQAATFFAVTQEAGPWDDIADFGFTQVLCIRAFAAGSFAASEIELTPTPVRQTISMRSEGNNDITANFFNASAQTEETGKSVTAKGGVSKDEISKKATQHSRTVFEPRATHSGFASEPRVVTNYDQVDDRRERNPLDDVTNYRIFRDNTQIAEVDDAVLTYTDLNRIENTQYTYVVRAVYDDNSVSDPSNSVTAMCNMEPAAPTGLVGNPLGNTQMALAWAAPTTNADGTPLVDLAGYRVYRDGVQIGTTNAGVTTYVDTPPESQFFYTWTVTARDEVPNVSDPSAGVYAAVESPWEEVDNEWVDITGVGTSAGITADDQIVGPFDLGFSIEYFGENYTQVYMCSNGWAAFVTNGFAAYGNGQIPDGAEPNGALYAFWDDLYPPAGGTYFYYQDTANDRFIMSWINAPHIGVNTETYTFQIIIEAGGGIYFNYNNITAEGTYGNFNCTVGVENATSDNAVQVCVDGEGGFLPETNTAVAFWGGPSGSVSGLVRGFQPTTPINGAEVTADEVPGELALTDAQGNYELGLEPGTYTVRVHKQGYCDVVFEDVVIEDGVSTTRNASMRTPTATFSRSSLNMYTLIGNQSHSTFDITNPGGQCEVEFTITTNQTWLTANPATGVVMPNETVTIAMTGATQTFNEGEYTAQVSVSHNDDGSPYLIPVTVTMALDADDSPLIPTEFALKSSYPNPFNATTALNFDVPNESLVEIVIYNVAGQEVARPVNQIMAAGSHRVLYTADNLPTGMYLVRMTAGSFHSVQKIVLLK